MKLFRSIASAAIAVIIAAGASATPARAVNLITNGGFETSDFTGWTTTPAATGSHLVVNNFGHTGSYEALFADGTVGSYDQLSQSVATTAGHNYLIDYWVHIGTEGATNDFFASWNGTQVPGSDVLNQFTFNYTEFTFTVAATGASTPLQFSAYDSGGWY